MRVEKKIISKKKVCLFAAYSILIKRYILLKKRNMRSRARFQTRAVLGDENMD